MGRGWCFSAIDSATVDPDMTCKEGVCMKQMHGVQALRVMQAAGGRLFSWSIHAGGMQQLLQQYL